MKDIIKSETFIVKSKTNNGDLCKQIFYLLVENNNPETYALICNKYVLSGDSELYNKDKILRKYKDKYLFFSVYGVKLRTLSKVLQWLIDLNIEI